MQHPFSPPPPEMSRTEPNSLLTSCLDLPPLVQLGIEADQLGVIVVDHGSRRHESNQLLLEVAREFQGMTGLKIVEPAHMDLAEPSIRTAVDRAAQQGARLIVVFPYFLAPGQHWQQDIPRLSAEATRQHPGLQYLVTAPLGLHPLLVQVIGERIQQCLAHAIAQQPPCEVCRDLDGCQMRVGGHR